MKSGLWKCGSLAIAAVLTAGCGGESGRTYDINDHVRTLDYDPAALLNVRPIQQATERKEAGKALETDEAQGPNLLICRETKYDLESNAEEVAILRPTEGIVWPGAAVKANSALRMGMPEPITLERAPITLSVDLPGLDTAHGTFVVEQPSNSAVQGRLNEVLGWWNENAYQDGYVNAARSSYRASTSFSSEQLAIDVGLNVRWCTGDVASQFSRTSSKTASVAMMVFKQVFYTVNVDTPASPAAFFAETVQHADCEEQMTPASPPGYVSSVNYGRILMFRLETTEAHTTTDLEATMHYAAGIDVNASLKTRYESILKTSTMTAVAIGGNAEATSEVVTAKTFGDLVPVIKKYAVYSKSNPGVPIAYTVRFMKDNSIAKMGYTTDYTATDCMVWKESRLSVENGSGYVTRAAARFYPRHQTNQVLLGTGRFIAGDTKTLVIPAGATNVELWADYLGVLGWHSLFYKEWDVAPETGVRYCLGGLWPTTPSWKDCTPKPTP